MTKTTSSTESAVRASRKTRVGRVVSAGMQKTIVIVLERKLKHPLYGKTIRSRTKLYAHDERQEAGVGDTVRVMETRPISKMKRWRLSEIIERAK